MPFSRQSAADDAGYVLELSPLVKVTISIGDMSGTLLNSTGRIRLEPGAEYRQSF